MLVEAPSIVHRVTRIDDPDMQTTLLGTGRQTAKPWARLAPDYEKARAREDSLDRLVEWPAQREILGEITGRSVLDLGCGNGGKLVELVQDGAVASIGVDISGNFVTDRPEGLELISGDLSDLGAIPELSGRKFDRILFLQSFGYTPDPVRTLREATSLLTDDGFILLTRTQPIRYALERAEKTTRPWVRSTSPVRRSPTAAGGMSRFRLPSGHTRCPTCSTCSAQPACG
ncbi:class I SAM-dependent methyltransferase [Arthrobacter sp. ISL-48]|nr:class I SAM-dependent methyltransferase [Arthrobacter sp. ISL-48]